MNDLILYLIPSALTDNSKSWLLPGDIEIVKMLDYFVVENAKTARKHLRALGVTRPLQEIQMMTLNKNTYLDHRVFSDFLLTGQKVGVMSEAGCPGVADPGAWLVRLAHQMNFQVWPMIGPSSILLALMASGSNGQRFIFRGYLPIEKNQLGACIKEMIKRIEHKAETQIFIETPYRNNSLYEFLLQNLPDSIMMTLAINLTDIQKQNIFSQSINDWKKSGVPSIDKQPCIFILGY